MQAFLLDEYVGLPPSHPQSYAHVIRAEFTDHVDIDPARVHGPDGVADDIFDAADRLRRDDPHAGPVDVQLLGIGVNGHIGFNEPGSSLGSRTRVTDADRADATATTRGSSRASTRCPATSSRRAWAPSAQPGTWC